MSISLFDVSNKLKVTFSTVLSGVVLFAQSVVFSEVVPNAEQAALISKFFAFTEGLVAEFGPTAAPGSLFDPAAAAAVSFQVLSADGTVLFDEDVSFDPSVPNEQQALLLARLAEFGSTLAGENAAA